MDDMRRNLVDLTGTLRQREAEAQAVLGGIVEGVYAVDGERRIRYLNPQAARLLGVTRGRGHRPLLRRRAQAACGANGVRPCETSCPILRARAAGPAAAIEHLRTGGGDRRIVVITSARPVETCRCR